MRYTLLVIALAAWPAFGGECFCLVDADDSVWFDCRAQKRPMRTQPSVFCAADHTGKPIELTGRPGLTRVADGAAPCTPCRLSDAAGPGRATRGDGESPGTSAEPAEATPPVTGEDRP